MDIAPYIFPHAVLSARNPPFSLSASYSSRSSSQVISSRGFLILSEATLAILSYIDFLGPLQQITTIRVASTTETYSLIVSEARCPKSRCSQGQALGGLGRLWEGILPCLFCFLWLVAASLQFLPLPSHGHLLCVCVSLLCVCYKHTCHWI